MIKVDRDKTAKKVRKFFKYDLQNYKDFSGDNTFSLKSINLNANKVKNQSNYNHTEQYYLALIQAHELIEEVKSAIQHCKSEYIKPLNIRFSNTYQYSIICNSFGYSERGYYNFENKAFNNFADIFLLEQIKNDNDKVIDLHIYKKVSSEIDKSTALKLI